MKIFSFFILKKLFFIKIRKTPQKKDDYQYSLLGMTIERFGTGTVPFRFRSVYFFSIPKHVPFKKLNRTGSDGTG